MEKIQRILAIIGIVIIAVSALLTLIFAILGSLVGGEFFTNAWKASAFCMIMFPCLLYAMFLIYKVLNKR